MGMEGKLRQVSEFELAKYRKNPSEFYSKLIKSYDLGELSKLTEAMRGIQESPLAKKVRQRALSGLPPEPEDVAEMQRQMQAVMGNHPQAAEQIESHIGPSEDGLQLSLHKSWHCLHFVLTGASWDAAEPPLGNAIMGGVEIPDRQNAMGYGPARYLTPSQVREVAIELVKFPIQEKAEAFDPEIAEEKKVYVPDHDKEELIYYFDLLRDFYQAAAAKGNGVILWVE
jgi:hypothetical protein